MKKIVIVFNPRSTQARRVQQEVLDALQDQLLQQYEVDDTNVDANAEQLARMLDDGDLVISAGGDATAIIGLNAVMLSGKDAVFAALPYGNFNDTARSLGLRNLDDALSGQAVIVWPIELLLDGQHFRYDLNYFTVGMFAESTKIFDEPKKREWLQSQRKGKLIFSFVALAQWWFRHRRDTFIKDKITDFVVINGVSMAKILRGRKFFLGRKFIWATGNLSGLWGLMRIVVPSILSKIPGQKTHAVTFDLGEQKTVTIQGSGEYKQVSVQEITARKEKSVNVIMRQ
ncbi:acylglycerol kinase family protein [Candidatus Saccharibacteria bacterium]|nr:acylglycerol kinase family protein [Candidatus Saccharibacteria bacterium]